MENQTNDPVTQLISEPVIQTEQQPKQSNFLVVLLSILLIISVAISGFFAYQTQKLVKELTILKSQEKVVAVATTEPTVEPVATNSAVATADPTANWKTYGNLMYNFKYPENWTLNDLTKGIQVEVYYQPDRTKSVGSLLIEKIDQDPGDISQYKVRRQIGQLEAVCKSDPSGIKTWCYVTENRISILIIKDQNGDYNKIIDLIISTISFTG